MLSDKRSTGGHRSGKERRRGRGAVGRGVGVTIPSPIAITVPTSIPFDLSPNTSVNQARGQRLEGLPKRLGAWRFVCSGSEVQERWWRGTRGLGAHSVGDPQAGAMAEVGCQDRLRIATGSPYLTDKAQAPPYLGLVPRFTNTAIGPSYQLGVRLAQYHQPSICGRIRGRRYQPPSISARQ